MTRLKIVASKEIDSVVFFNQLPDGAEYRLSETQIIQSTFRS